jgi:hypothetical protein
MSKQLSFLLGMVLAYGCLQKQESSASQGGKVWQYIDQVKIKQDFLEFYGTDTSHVPVNIEVLKLSNYTFNAIPDEIIVAKLRFSQRARKWGAEAFRILVLRHNTDNQAKIFYDTHTFEIDCENPDIQIGNVEVLTIDHRPILFMEETRKIIGCAGVSRKEISNLLVFDVSKEFEKQLEFEIRFIDFGNDDAENTVPICRYSFYFSNFCLDNCQNVYTNIYDSQRPIDAAKFYKVLTWDDKGEKLILTEYQAEFEGR